MDEAIIEDLAFGVRTSRGIDLRVCLNEVSYAEAEKDERRMVLKRETGTFLCHCDERSEEAIPTFF